MAVVVGVFLIEGVNVPQCVCVCAGKCLFGSYASVFLGPLVVTVD